MFYPPIQVMDRRIEIRELGVFLTDLRESDVGIYSESPDGKKDKFIRLKVLGENIV